MSSYKINYSGKEKDEKDEKILTALKDIDNWFNGQKVFINTVGKEMFLQDIFFDAISYGCTYKQFSFMIGMNGISGYPVAAFWMDVKDSLHTMTQ